jgi:hypothetical protein
MASQSEQPKRKSKADRWVKVGFLVAILAVAALVYVSQTTDPGLPGWGKDLPAALRQAQEKNTKVVVVFTGSPMSEVDVRLVKETLTRRRTTVKVLNHLGYLKVHLSVRKHKRIAERYGVRSNPVVLLLDAEGKEIKRHSGFLLELPFCADFLGVPASEVQDSR